MPKYFNHVLNRLIDINAESIFYLKLCCIKGDSQKDVYRIDVENAGHDSYWPISGASLLANLEDPHKRDHMFPNNELSFKQLTGAEVITFLGFNPSEVSSIKLEGLIQGAAAASTAESLQQSQTTEVDAIQALNGILSKEEYLTLSMEQRQFIAANLISARRFIQSHELRFSQIQALTPPEFHELLNGFDVVFLCGFAGIGVSVILSLSQSARTLLFTNNWSANPRKRDIAQSLYQVHTHNLLVGPQDQDIIAAIIKFNGGNILSSVLARCSDTELLTGPEAQATYLDIINHSNPMGFSSALIALKRNMLLTQINREAIKRTKGEERKIIMLCVGYLILQAHWVSLEN